MAGKKGVSKKGRSGGAEDRMGGIAKAKEAAARGASERAAERAGDPQRDAAQRGESPDPTGRRRDEA